MTGRRSSAVASLVVRHDEPLIGLILEEDGREVVRYFSSEEEADRVVPTESAEGALALAGAWRDLDWESMASELDRIRHESPPSPPLSL